MNYKNEALLLSYEFARVAWFAQIWWKLQKLLLLKVSNSPPARLNQVQFALNIKHAFFDAML